MKLSKAIRLDLSPAQEKFNEKLVEELTLRRGVRRPRWPSRVFGSLGKEWRVVIDEEFRSFGTFDEYPANWVGVEQDYSPRERLVLLHFSKHFIGKSFRGGRSRPERKTDPNKCLWIPEWFLVPFQLSGEAKR